MDEGDLPIWRLGDIVAWQQRLGLGMRRLTLLLVVLLLPLSARAQTTVFAAASLTDALNTIGADWQKAGHPAVRFSFGASSTLARQIAEGAPANVFASADQQWMDYLQKKDLLAPGTRVDLLTNRLVLVVPENGPDHVKLSPGFDLAALLGPNGRLATGDPAHVPVGIYAAQALKKLGVWDYAQQHLAPAADVRSALLLVERGEAPAGIVYSTDAAVAKGLKITAVFPEDTHDPISYPFAILKGADTAEARSFMSYLQGPDARAVFDKYGFGLKGTP